MSYKLVTCCAALLLAMGISAFAADTKITSTVFVFSKTANLMEEGNTKAKVIAALDKGTALDVLETRDLWLKVKVANKTGWVNKYLVSETKPSLEKANVEDMKINLKKEARKRASAYSTAASARGLADDTAATKNVKSDLEAVKKMEDRKVSTAEVKSFIKEGKLK